MLLIACPWCGARPENEFRYGGEAHIARPRDPASVDDAAWADFLYMRSNPKGMHAERWRHIHGCGRFFNCVRDTVSDRISRHLQARRGAAAMTRCVSHARRRPHRPRAAARRSASTAGGITGCHGDTLASALLANGVHLVGRSFKYHRPRGILSAGSEEPNALVTIDRGAGRVTPNLRATQLELYDGLRARSQNRFPSLAFDLGAVSNALAPLLSGRLLLQDLHVAARILAARVRACDPRRRRSGACADRCRSRSLSASLRPLRRAGDRRRPRRSCRRARRIGERRARDAVRRTGGARRIVAGGDRGTHRRAGRVGLAARNAGDAGAARRCDAAAAHHGIRLVSRQSHRPRASASPIIWRDPDPRLPRERLWQVRAQQGGDRRRRDRTAAGVSRQRPAGRHAGRRRAHLSARATA